MVPPSETEVEPLASALEVPPALPHPVESASATALLEPLPLPEEPAPRRAGPFGSARVLATVAQVSGLALLAYAFLFNLSVVRGSSMAPGIHDGDRILIDHVSYLLGTIHRGDIAVLKYPLDPTVDYIKRIIGLPGDEILLEDGQVWVNGQKLSEPYVAATDRRSRLFTRVKPAHYFVLGDNRPRSSDSREFGQVPADYVRGKVELRVWPPTRFGPIQ